LDYQRIYREFIADRKRKPRPEGYTERHHIVPRSLGGGDEAANLIDLTAEDHFFAHLLLARIHGGVMGSALFLLLQSSNRHWRQRYRSRASYGLARRLAARGLAESWTGERNPLFNPTQFNWVNCDTGETRRATMAEMHAKVGGSRPHWTNVARGVRKTYRGWTIAGRALSVRSSKGKQFKFVNRDGREFVGTQGQFAQAFGFSVANASRIARKGCVSKCGWRLEGVPDRPIGVARDGRFAWQHRKAELRR
jgi:hypothetical protein